jgi:hypothetical protein
LSDSDEWDDCDQWDNDDYDEFVEREFPDSSSPQSSLPAIWKWTAWTLLAMIVLFWALAG